MARSRLRLVCLWLICRPADTAAVLSCGGSLRVHQLSLGQMNNYQYLIDNGIDAVSVDAAWDISRIRRYVEKLGLRLVGGLYTHGHFDHTGGQMPGMSMGGSVQGAAEMQDLPIWIGAQDVAAAELQTGLGEKAWRAVRDGDSISVLGDHVEVTVVDTPGHSKGGVTFWVRGREVSEECAGGLLFTGDSVFIKNVGRTDLPGADQETLLRSLARLSLLPDAALVLPGHSYDSPPRRAALGHVKTVNGFMKQAMSRFPPSTLPPLPVPSSARPASDCSN
eukprot:TRINITY_DN111915_c0_g1_i1.p1 TRINITY_DN111915_c0_g1~~TRINITY_DN111915_c0_g1_i1.p1  ORF type:complete len:278 (-),score=52.61 TRINITY_DN111915_c0_g1_i1:68-901(-)